MHDDAASRTPPTPTDVPLQALLIARLRQRGRHSLAPRAALEPDRAAPSRLRHDVARPRLAPASRRPRRRQAARRERLAVGHRRRPLLLDVGVGRQRGRCGRRWQTHPPNPGGSQVARGVPFLSRKPHPQSVVGSWVRPGWLDGGSSELSGVGELGWSLGSRHAAIVGCGLSQAASRCCGWCQCPARLSARLKRLDRWPFALQTCR